MRVEYRASPAPMTLDRPLSISSSVSVPRVVRVSVSSFPSSSPFPMKSRENNRPPPPVWVLVMKRCTSARVRSRTQFTKATSVRK